MTIVSVAAALLFWHLNFSILWLKKISNDLSPTSCSLLSSVFRTLTCSIEFQHRELGDIDFAFVRLVLLSATVVFDTSGERENQI